MYCSFPGARDDPRQEASYPQNSTEVEICSYQKTICATPSPCAWRMWDGASPRCYLGTHRCIPGGRKNQRRTNQSNSHPHPPSPSPTKEILQGTPQRNICAQPEHSTAGHHPQSPLWDIEVCTAVQLIKRRRLHTPLHYTPVPAPKPTEGTATPITLAPVATQHFVGPARVTFHTPQTRLPVSPRVSQRLLDSLNLVLMEDEEESSVHLGSPRSDASHESGNDGDVQHRGVTVCNAVNCS